MPSCLNHFSTVMVEYYCKICISILSICQMAKKPIQRDIVKHTHVYVTKKPLYRPPWRKQHCYKELHCTSSELNWPKLRTVAATMENVSFPCPRSQSTGHFMTFL